ncbi:MAG: tetratricopeptide repeat protein [Nitrospiraceae bacterium]|nr:MAG: tetratricopeptide repeat protein [Nitrospiraceae bacterium]
MSVTKCLVSLLLVYLLIACTAPEVKNYETPESSAFYDLGVAYLNENKIQKAFVEFQKAYSINPSDKRILNAIGIIYLLHFDDTPKAISFFEKAVNLDTTYSEAYNNLGFAHESLGNFETAISYYEKAVANLMYATPEKAYINLANVHYRLGKYDLAIAAIREALKRAPTLSIAYMKLALCYNALGRYGDASTALSSAIVLDPLYQGDVNRAIEELTDMEMRASGYEQQDIRDYLEILKY